MSEQKLTPFCSGDFVKLAVNVPSVPYNSPATGYRPYLRPRLLPYLATKSLFHQGGFHSPNERRSDLHISHVHSGGDSRGCDPSIFLRATSACQTVGRRLLLKAPTSLSVENSSILFKLSMALLSRNSPSCQTTISSIGHPAGYSSRGSSSTYRKRSNNWALISSESGEKFQISREMDPLSSHTGPIGTTSRSGCRWGWLAQ